MRDVFRNLGLTNNETDVYLALLEMKDVGITKISSRSGLHRQVCYDVLERLMEKGFVSYVVKNGKKHFSALNPKKIVDLLDEQKEDLVNVLPQLLKLAEKQEGDVSVELIKGKSALKTLLTDMIRTMRRTKTLLYAMGVDETEFLKFDEISIRRYIRLMRKYRMKEYLLTKESATTFFEGSQSIYRVLPDHMFNPNSTQIYGDKIAMIIWGNPTYVIVIKSKKIADAYKKYFKMLWKMAKPRKHI